MRTFLYKLGMLLNVIWAIDLLRRPELDLAILVISILGFTLSFAALALHDLRIDHESSKFLNEVYMALIMNATHEELDELRRQLKSGLELNAAKYTRQLFEKYEKKDG